MTVTDRAFALRAARPQPFVGTREALAAVIGLRDGDRRGLSVDDHDRRMADGIRDGRDGLREVQRRVLGMADAEEQDLTSEIVHATDRAVGTVRR